MHYLIILKGVIPLYKALAAKDQLSLCPSLGSREAINHLSPRYVDLMSSLHVDQAWQSVELQRCKPVCERQQK